MTSTCPSPCEVRWNAEDDQWGYYEALEDLLTKEEVEGFLVAKMLPNASPFIPVTLYKYRDVGLCHKTLKNIEGSSNDRLIPLLIPW